MKIMLVPRKGLFLCLLSEFSEACQISWNEVSLKERQLQLTDWWIHETKKMRKQQCIGLIWWYRIILIQENRWCRYSRSPYAVIYLSIKSTSLLALASDAISCVWWDCQVGGSVISGFFFHSSCPFTYILKIIASSSSSFSLRKML